MPLTTASTSGAPTSSRQPRTISITVSGVSSEGLISAALPAISAGSASPSERITGKFQGLISPTTPNGR